jgi:hypothetical protein
VHVSAKNIYDPYKTGGAWEITRELLENYSHGILPPVLERVEGVFIAENDAVEEICYQLINKQESLKVVDMLSLSDNMLQRHGYQMMQILLEIPGLDYDQTKNDNDTELNAIIDKLNTLWSNDYNTSMIGMLTTVNEIENYAIGYIENNKTITQLALIKELIMDIIKNAAWYKLRQAECMVGQENNELVEVLRIYYLGVDAMDQNNYTNAGGHFIKVFGFAGDLVEGRTPGFENVIDDQTDESEEQSWLYTRELWVTVIIILAVIICAIARLRLKKKK